MNLQEYKEESNLNTGIFSSPSGELIVLPGFPQWIYLESKLDSFPMILIAFAQATCLAMKTFFVPETGSWIWHHSPLKWGLFLHQIYRYLGVDH